MRPPSTIAGRRLALLLGWAAFAVSAFAQNSATESEVKAAYLYNFAKFVQWPAPPSDKFRICILGSDSLGKALETTVQGERLQGRPVELKRTGSAEVAASSCDMVFIAGSERGHLGEILRSFTKNHILTVSDIPHFVDKGGIIGFVVQDNRVRFEANQDAAQNAGLTLSSELLKVAVAVKKGGR